MEAWTREETEIIKAEYARTGPVILSARLGRSVKSVTGKARNLGISTVAYRSTAAHRKWTDAEREFLEANFATMGPAEIARILDRSTYSVKCRCQFLGLKSPRAEARGGWVDVEPTPAEKAAVVERIAREKVSSLEFKRGNSGPTYPPSVRFVRSLSAGTIIRRRGFGA